MSKAENKTKATKASVAGFIAAVPDEAKRKDAMALIKLMQNATGESPRCGGRALSVLARSTTFTIAGRAGDMPLIGFSPRKPALVLYGVARSAEAMLDKLGKHTTGKGCLYIKRLSDVDEKILKR
ncbi:MAG: hypothetical protein WDM89_09910 [Rhizomicrobium sp.]